MANKKGIMLKFITTLILALIIFVPGCMFVSKFFALSEQAKSNFYSFAEEIKTFAEKGQEGEAKGTVLILDKGTFIMNIWSNYAQGYKRCPAGLEEHISGPGDVCAGKDCLCLIREFEKKETQQKANYCGDVRPIVEIIPKKFYCVEIPDNFYIYGLDWRHWTRFGDDAPRRIVMGMVKKGNIVFVCDDTPCQIPDKLQDHPTKKAGVTNNICVKEPYDYMVNNAAVNKNGKITGCTTMNSAGEEGKENPWCPTELTNDQYVSSSKWKWCTQEEIANVPVQAVGLPNS